MRSMKLLVPVLFLAAACSKQGGTTSGSGDPPFDGTGPATVAEYCDQYWAAYATRWTSCQHGSAAEAATVYAPGPRCADPVQAVAAGRATYAASRAGGCLSFIETASCDVLEAFMADLYPQADCEAAVAGSVARYGTCYSNASCASGLCIWSPTICPSICETPIPQASACGTGVPCAKGSYCNLGTHLCTAVVGDGGACNYAEPCAPGLFCEQIGPGNSLCHARKTSGSCVGDDQCAIGYHCASGSATCVAWLGAGETCTQGQNGCGPGLWCGGAGACIDGPTATQPCTTVNGELRPCIGGACAPGTSGSTCSAWLTAGATCTLPAQCAPTDACVGTGTKSCTTLCAEP